MGAAPSNNQGLQQPLPPPQHHYSDGTPIRSLQSRYRITVRFHNRTNEVVRVFWIDYQGREQEYGPPCAPFGQPGSTKT